MVMMPDWHRHCAEIAVEHIRKTTGRDLWKELGPCPRGWREAAEFYRRNDAHWLAEIVTKALGPPVDPKRARRGDICMVELTDQFDVPQGRDGGLGICRGEWVECADRMRPLRLATKAWHL